jgi:hypothetical protein
MQNFISELRPTRSKSLRHPEDAGLLKTAAISRTMPIIGTNTARVLDYHRAADQHRRQAA